MAALGDVSRDIKAQPATFTYAIPGALGVGNTDFSRYLPPTGGGGSGPSWPTYGQIFPNGRG